MTDAPKNSANEKAVVLVSGGLDSAVTLAIAVSSGYDCTAVSVSYGQRHVAELNAAKEVAAALGATDHRQLSINLDAIGGSALTDRSIAVPESPTEGIPATYVPARNTLFLSLALGLAEVIDARDLFIGVNAVDYSGYPDCRPAFVEAFEQLANLATRAGVEAVEEGSPWFRVRTPLISMTKAEIIRQGVSLGVDFSQTVSCYSADADGLACGQCDSCRIRRQGFADAGIPDPTRYRNSNSAK